MSKRSCSSCIYFKKDNSKYKCRGECTNEFRQTHHPAYYNNIRSGSGRACQFYREVINVTEIELNKRTPVERLIIANTLIDSVIRESELELVNEKLSECMKDIESCKHVLALMEEVS